MRTRTIAAFGALAASATLVDTVTGKTLKPIPVGGNPDAIAITPDGKTAYAVNQATSTVTPIRTATNKALKPIHIPGLAVIQGS